jgi:hypothetical protein
MLGTMVLLEAPTHEVMMSVAASLTEPAPLKIQTPSKLSVVATELAGTLGSRMLLKPPEV